MDKKYDHSSAEQEARQLWESEQTYTTENNPGTIYSIDTPPPTVSGAIHIGHIFSYTQTDIIARYKRMSGFSVFYPFGFDDNGLPTERYIEKKKKVSAHSLGRSEFIKLTLQETAETEKQFKNLWQQMGLSVDWNKCYSTISEPIRKISQESFIKLYEKKHIYRKEEPALYCTTCRTTVAQAELDSIDVPSKFNDIVFKTEDNQELVIATTRPELLPSCVALLYHPDDKRYKKLLGKKAIVPIFGHTVPIYEDVTADPEKGTGLVMVCTFGDSTDVLWCKKHNLPYIQSIGLDGKFIAATGQLAGLKVAPAREKILELLKEKGVLGNQEEITHTVNVHERCNKEIEYTVLKQWFLNILEHKQTFLDLADKINWQPSFMKARYVDWVKHISWDWCLSRQRFYGIPFPAWHCQECGQILLARTKDLPIDPQETSYPGTCSNCKGSNIVPDTDVMDTWNTASLTPYICIGLLRNNNEGVFDGKIEELPMSMRPQAHDIIRTWAFYTIIKTWMHHDSIPWHNIVISGHVLSESKEKLSKSKGQKALAPEHLLKAYPADAIRYWAASGALGQDVAFSENQLKIGRRLVTKLWNAFRFTREHLQDFKPSDQPPANLGVINEWLLHKASLCFTTYSDRLDESEFGPALDSAEQFFWHDFCDNYIELIKDQLFNPDKYSIEQVEATRWTLYNVGLRLLQLYAPYLPHLTETIYSKLYKQHLDASSLHQTKFKNAQKAYDFSDSAHQMQIIIDVVNQVRKLKSKHQLSLKTDLATLTITSSDKLTLKIIKQQESLLRGVTHAQEIILGDQPTEQSTLTKKDDQWSGTIVL